MKGGGVVNIRDNVASSQPSRRALLEGIALAALLHAGPSLSRTGKIHDVKLVKGLCSP